MNKFIQGLNIKENSKGGLYHGSTLESNLDLFAISGRGDEETKLKQMFQRAYVDNTKMAFKNVFNFLDIRGGKGERRAGSILLSELFHTLVDEEDVAKLAIAVSELNRWDMVINLYCDNANLAKSNAILTLINNQLNDDMSNYADGKNISLLAKWMPSINTSNKEQVLKAKFLMKKLEITNEKTYRQLLSSLRKHINVLEVNMSSKNYGAIAYDKVPSQALRRHTKAFERNDAKAFEEYLFNLAKGFVKAKAGAVWPSQLVFDVFNNDAAIADGQWKNLPNFFTTNKNVLVVADVSSSMGHVREKTIVPIHSAIALALYTSERNTGVFKNKFLTFRNEPELAIVKGIDLQTKIGSIAGAEWGGSTNINKTFGLILQASISANKEDCPEYIVIVSDMEFDSAAGNTTNFDYWKSVFKKHEIKLPKIIFWNVARNTKGFPVTKFTENVAMVSGDSPSIIEKLFSLEDISPIDYMEETLSKYDNYL